MVTSLNQQLTVQFETKRRRHCPFTTIVITFSLVVPYLLCTTTSLFTWIRRRRQQERR